MAATIVDANNTNSVIGKISMTGRFLSEGSETSFNLGGDQLLPAHQAASVDLSDIHDNISALEKKVVGQFRKELESERTKVPSYCLTCCLAHLLTKTRSLRLFLLFLIQ